MKQFLVSVQGTTFQSISPVLSDVLDGEISPVLDGEIYRQTSGGSIGLDLTGVISDIYMCHWDEVLLEKLEIHDIIVHLYKRYKDDVNLAMETREENPLWMSEGSEEVRDQDRSNQ